MAVKDDSGAVIGWRPPGGGIEFGESAVAALEREILEELGQTIECGQRLCVFENIYRHEGALGHELVFVFDTAFVEPAAYEIERYRFIDQAIQNEVTWRKLELFVRGREQLLPAGLAAQLG